MTTGKAIALLLLISGLGRAAEIVADSASRADVVAAIASASSGDTVVVPPGSATWDDGVTLTKGLTLISSGVTITRGATSAVLLAITTEVGHPTRISGFSFQQTTAANQLTVGGGFSRPLFRIDNCSFFTTAGSAVLVRVFNAWGLIDNCTFTGDDASEMLHNEAWGPSDATGWAEDVTPGSPDALYVEDCTFSKYDLTDAYFWGTSAIQSYYGARTVFRYNTLNYCQVDQHGTPGAIGARWWEIYENDFVIPTGGSRNQSSYMDIRGGSGVIFNNTKSGGTNLGAGSISLREEDSGYPALYQIGRGKDQALDPAYAWGNTAATPSSGSSNVELDRDFFLSEKPDYTPAAYPHPMRGELSAPSFTLDPSSATRTVGESVTFNAVAVGNPSPTYQWRKSGDNISGATSASYTIASVELSDAGTFDVVATNSEGVAFSSAAVLTVNAGDGGEPGDGSISTQSLSVGTLTIGAP